MKVVARFGVGYDNVDVPACTRAGVLLTITPEGVRRPVAVAALTLLLALSHKLLIKDRLVRRALVGPARPQTARGSPGGRSASSGSATSAASWRKLARPLGLSLIGLDPWVAPEAAAAAGVTVVPLDELLGRADYVCVCLRPDAGYAPPAERRPDRPVEADGLPDQRGPRPDRRPGRPLRGACGPRGVQGAGLDVFEQEPVDPDDPILALDNVILAPHALCWTDECFGLNGRSAIAGLIDVARGVIPRDVVNRDALAHERLRHLRPRGGRMRDNRVKQALRSGGVSMGVMCLEFATTGIGPLSAAAGPEFAVFDMEHTGWGLETIRMLVATSRAADLVPIVRVPTADYHFIAHALDVGAMGLVLPLVESAEQAEFAVECAMYPPRGRRGCAFAIAHDDFRGATWRPRWGTRTTTC